MTLTAISVYFYIIMGAAIMNMFLFCCVAAGMEEESVSEVKSSKKLKH